MLTLTCSRCDKKLSKKRARIIDGKVLCSACLFDNPVMCGECGKPRGAKGWLGPGCVCSVKAGSALTGAPSVGTQR